jgi:2-polyprenyl-3-methyl-5-hydroxy-6-metoxy-1,4-benzoquinol methylase
MMTASLVDDKNEAYRNQQRDIKEHEKVMLRLIEATASRGPIDVLDVGCADGLFLEAVSNQIACRTVHGIDTDPELVSVARQRPYRADRSGVFLEDAWALTGDEPVADLDRYDVIIASGLLTFFEDQDRIVRGLCRYLKDDGRLFLFNRINSADVDLRYWVRAAGTAAWGEFRMVPALITLTSVMGQYLRDVTVQRFELPFDLPETASMHATRTIRTADGSRLLMTKYNIAGELAFLYGQRR